MIAVEKMRDLALKCKEENWLEFEVLEKCEDGKYVLKDSEGYMYRSSIGVVKKALGRNSILAKYFRNNPYTIHNIENFVKSNRPKWALNSNSILHAKEDVDWICKDHGVFKASWNCIQRGSACGGCGLTKRSESRKHDYEYVKTQFKVNGFILVSDTYKNNQTPLNYICLRHKEKGVQKMTFGNFTQRKNNGCFYCSREKLIAKMTKTHQQFENEVISVHNNKYTLLDEYGGARNEIKTRCNECGNVWDVRAQHLLKGHGCPRCARVSLGEDKIRGYLETNKINFCEEYRISDCRYKKPLPFDFAVLDKNEELFCLIEFDGKQHFEPYGFGCKSEVEVDESFKLIQKRDDIKDNYCKTNRIKLIRIPYWEIEKVESILESKVARKVRDNEQGKQK